MFRGIVVAGAAVLALGGCEPKSPEAPAAGEAATVADADVEARNALLMALTPVIEYELGNGQKLSFQVVEARTQGDWGWIHATPLTLDGAPVDWSKTKFDDQNRDGLLDGGGATRALLQKVVGVWEVRAFNIGATDVAWQGWPEEYGAPAEVMGLKGTTL